jgi:hypothetical protein
MIKKHLLISSLAMLSAFLLGNTAFAQDADQVPEGVEAEGVLEEIVVTGVKFSMTEAVGIKRDSVQIVDSIVSEDIGKFPDNNVVEAMQRIAGVQVTNRGAGEVATVSIRGLSDVTTTINGRTSSRRPAARWPGDIPLLWSTGSTSQDALSRADSRAWPARSTFTRTGPSISMTSNAGAGRASTRTGGRNRSQPGLPDQQPLGHRGGDSVRCSTHLTSRRPGSTRASRGVRSIPDIG